MALPHLLEYPKDKLWPKIDPKVSWANDLGTAPDSSQGGVIVPSVDRGCNNLPKAKKLKLTVDRANWTARLIGNYADAVDLVVSGKEEWEMQVWQQRYRHQF